MHIKLIIMILFVFLSSQKLFSSDLNDIAFYKVNKDPRRTSSIIKDGELKMYLDFVQEEVYILNLDYWVKTSIAGTIHKQKRLKLPKHYFDGTMLEELKAYGFYQSPMFKAVYLGQSTITNIDGTTYNQCDIIYLYELNLEDNSDDTDRKLKDLIIYITTDIPILAAARLDIKENMMGILIPVGFDYIP